jgi:hypothetical protein
LFEEAEELDTINLQFVYGHLSSKESRLHFGKTCMKLYMVFETAVLLERMERWKLNA